MDKNKNKQTNKQHTHCYKGYFGLVEDCTVMYNNIAELITTNSIHELTYDIHLLQCICLTKQFKIQINTSSLPEK